MCPFFASCFHSFVSIVMFAMLASINGGWNLPDCVTPTSHWNSTLITLLGRAHRVHQQNRHSLARLFALNTGCQTNSGNTSWLGWVNVTQGGDLSHKMFLPCESFTSPTPCGKWRNVQNKFSFSLKIWLQFVKFVNVSVCYFFFQFQECHS